MAMEKTAAKAAVRDCLLGALGAVLLYYMPEKIRKHRGSEARRVH